LGRIAVGCCRFLGAIRSGRSAGVRCGPHPDRLGLHPRCAALLHRRLPLRPAPSATAACPDAPAPMIGRDDD
jgi:hypothetical protein